MELFRKILRSHQWQVRNEFGYLGGHGNKVSLCRIMSKDKKVRFYQVVMWWGLQDDPKEYFFTTERKAQEKYEEFIDIATKDTRVYSQEELKARWESSDFLRADYEVAKRHYEETHALIGDQHEC